MKTGFSLCSFSHRERPVFITWEPCNENRFFPVRKNYTGKSLFWPCTGPVRDCSETHKMKKIDLYAQIQEKTGICAPSRSNFMGSSCTKFEADHHCHGETFALYSLQAVKVVKIRYDFNNFEFHSKLSHIFSIVFF